MNDSIQTEALESMGYSLQNSSIYQDALDESQETTSLFSKKTVEVELS